MNLAADRFRANLEAVRIRMAAACDKAGRLTSEVQLLPVTKNHPGAAAQAAWEAGLPAVGENRVQEAIGKMDEVDPALRWELIGPLQSNKAKKVAERFARVQTVDRIKVAVALDRHAAEAGRKLHVLLQVNAGRDSAKSGVELEDAAGLLDEVMGCSHLVVDGLMTIAPLSEDRDVARRCFAEFRACRDRLSRSSGLALSDLSMGMSDDMEEAILEGSTMVRVGTALFGEREYGT